MSEFAQAGRIWAGNLGLHLDKWPSGRFGFCGSVPADLMFVKVDGTEISDEDIKELRQANMPAMVKKSRGIKTRAFDTAEQALEFARSRGYKVVQS